MDGLKLPIQQSSHWLKQNMFYNGWKSQMFVNNIFCFAPDGLIRIATINCPGSWHNSTQADYGVYQKLEGICNGAGALIVSKMNTTEGIGPGPTAPALFLWILCRISKVLVNQISSLSVKKDQWLWFIVGCQPWSRLCGQQGPTGLSSMFTTNEFK